MVDGNTCFNCERAEKKIVELADHLVEAYDSLTKMTVERNAARDEVQVLIDRYDLGDLMGCQDD